MNVAPLGCGVAASAASRPRMPNGAAPSMNIQLARTCLLVATTALGVACGNRQMHPDSAKNYGRFDPRNYSPAPDVNVWQRQEIWPRIDKHLNSPGPEQEQAFQRLAGRLAPLAVHAILLELECSVTRDLAVRSVVLSSGTQDELAKLLSLAAKICMHRKRVDPKQGPLVGDWATPALASAALLPNGGLVMMIRESYVADFLRGDAIAEGVGEEMNRLLQQRNALPESTRK